MPPAPSTFTTRYGPSRPSSPGPCGGARKATSSDGDRSAAPLAGTPPRDTPGDEGGGKVAGSRSSVGGRDDGGMVASSAPADAEGTNTAFLQWGHLPARPASSSLTFSF